ncbi:hypothetical protein EJD97_010272 [Solanum chilense]|uniref:Uncharacterized protein n=1 Tax=Solanum chilense TaxID=4083 RepID=A0A6N2AIS3_SOLCI|nr:hypothetical protein EJD97_010272 [Solanum chilense]
MPKVLLVFLSESIPQQLSGMFCNLTHNGTRFSTALANLKLGSHALTINGLACLRRYMATTKRFHHYLICCKI